MDYENAIATILSSIYTKWRMCCVLLSSFDKVHIECLRETAAFAVFSLPNLDK